MPSLREAPEISGDSGVDNADVYAFVSPDRPDTVTLISNFALLEDPPGGPNLFEFGNEVRYSIYVDNDGDGTPEIAYVFKFTVDRRDPNGRRLYSVTRVDGSDATAYDANGVHGRRPRLRARVLGHGLACPPVHELPGGIRVFAGPNKPLSVNTIAIQVPISHLTSNGTTPKDVLGNRAVIGVWSGASRRRTRTLERGNRRQRESGAWIQVSRLGNPLINGVVVPPGQMDRWNRLYPAGDRAFVSHYERPELAGLLPALYPKVFPNLAQLSEPREDLVTMLLTGIPPGIVPGFQNYTGKVMADQLRLNLAVPPTSSEPNAFGLLGGDTAGFPNGRRVFDDVVSIQLRAIAGVTYTLVDRTYKPDPAAQTLTQGAAPKREPYQSAFPYLAP